MYELHISSVWDILYFGIVNPIAYIGSTLTLLMVEILRYKRTVPALLIGILAINDFCLVIFCFTPTVIAQVMTYWCGEAICSIHAILNNFFTSPPTYFLYLCLCPWRGGGPSVSTFIIREFYPQTCVMFSLNVHNCQWALVILSFIPIYLKRMVPVLHKMTVIR